VSGKPRLFRVFIHDFNPFVEHRVFGPFGISHDLDEFFPLPVLRCIDTDIAVLTGINSIRESLMLDSVSAPGSDAVFIEERLRALADMESRPALCFRQVDVNSFTGHIAV